MSLTVIIPTLNPGIEIYSTIDAIKKSSSIDACYIVDGGVSAPEFSSSLSDKFELFQLPGSSIYEAMNFGLKKTNTQYIYFCGAGDIPLTEGIEKLLKYASGVNVVYGDIFHQKDSARYGGEFDKLRLGNGFMWHQSMIYCTEKLKSFSGFSEHYAVFGDAYVNLRLMSENSEQFRYVDTIVAEYRGGGVSDTCKDCRYVHDFAEWCKIESPEIYEEAKISGFLANLFVKHCGNKNARCYIDTSHAEDFLRNARMINDNVSNLIDSCRMLDSNFEELGNCDEKTTYPIFGGSQKNYEEILKQKNYTSLARLTLLTMSYEIRKSLSHLNDTPFYIYGAGIIGMRFFQQLQIDLSSSLIKEQFKGFIDRFPERCNTEGWPITELNIDMLEQESIFYICSQAWRDIVKKLMSIGIDSKKIYVVNRI